MKELQVFDALKADIATFVGPIPKLKVTDFKSSALAVEHGRTIQGLIKEVEARRDALVRPRNEEVKRVNEYAREIRTPLELAKKHLDLELGAFAAEQRRIEAEKQRKIDEERRAEEERIEREAREKREALEAEARELASDPTFGSLDDEQAEELARQQAKIDEEEAQAKMRATTQAAAAKYDASRQAVKGVRMVWECELIDINEVPVEFQIRELNKQAVLAMARAGQTNIPGVRVFQKPAVGFGQHTYVPQEAIQAENARERARVPSEPVRQGRRSPGSDVQPARRTAATTARSRATSGRRS